MELNFEETDRMSPKRRKVLQYTDDDQLDIDYELDVERSFNTISFYGKREKKSFPHSPQRRKTVKHVLSKLSNENQTPVSAVPNCSSEVVVNSKRVSDRALCQINEMFNKSPKVRLEKISVDKEMKIVSTTAVSIQENDVLTVTPTVEKKFFKHKIPASADKSRSVVVRKGFNLKFMPKQRTHQSSKQKKKKKKIIYTGKIKNVDSCPYNITLHKSFYDISQDETSREMKEKQTHMLNVNVCNDSDLTTDSACHIETPDSTCLSDSEKEQFPGSADLFSSRSGASGRSTPISENFSDISDLSGPSNRVTRSQEQGRKLFPIFNSNSSPESQSKGKTR